MTFPVFLGAGLALAGLVPVSPALAQSDSLSLEATVRAALASHPLGTAAREDARAAEARLRRAWSVFLPDVSASGSFEWRDENDPSGSDADSSTPRVRDQREYGLRFDQLLFDARALSLRRQAAHARGAARATEADVRRRVAVESARAFLLVLGAEQVVAAATRRVAYSEARLEESAARVGAALISTNDLSRAELEAANAERERARALREAEQARLLLGEWLGRDVREALLPPRSLLREAETLLLAPDLEGDVHELIARAERSRDDLRAARLRSAQRRAAARETHLGALPSLALQGEQRWTDEETGSGWDSERLLALTSTWSLFDAERFAERSERVAATRAAEADEERIARAIEREVRSALDGLRTTRAVRVAAIRAADAGRRNAEETAELYRQGLTTSLATVDAAVEQFEAEVEEARAALDLGLAHLDLRAALGVGPLDEEIAP